MTSVDVTVTTLGGPTVLLEIGPHRLLTDPTFDEPGEYPIGSRSLRKTAPAAWSVQEVGGVDAVLLSHDQHPDNLDHAGRRFTADAPLVLSTAAAAERLGGRVRALPNWTTMDLPHEDGGLSVTGVPARHGPPGCEPLTGEVTGFLLRGSDLPTVYVSGDNAHLGHVADLAREAGPVDLAVLFAGAAHTALFPDDYLTLTSQEAAEAAAILGSPHVVVVHTDSWAHFTETMDDVRAAFDRVGLGKRLHDVPHGQPLRL